MRIGQLSTHLGEGIPAIAKFIKHENLDVAGLTELDAGTHDKLNELKHELGADYLVYHVDEDKQHSHELALVVRKRRLWKTTLVTGQQLSADIPGRGTGNDRWLLTVRRKHRVIGRVRVHMLTHLNAGFQNPDTGDVRDHDVKAIANAQSMQFIKLQVAKYDAAGYHVTLQGDFNVKRVQGNKWLFTPDTYLVKYLTAVSRRLDWILFNKKWHQVGSAEVVPAHTAGNPADHDWLIINLLNGPGRRP